MKNQPKKSSDQKESTTPYQINSSEMSQGQFEQETNQARNNRKVMLERISKGLHPTKETPLTK
tara:strand:- start:96 stop:284 length:189 start_codon:yes stop_codon:yes gene_type:complete